LDFGIVKYQVTLVESEEGFAVWCDDLPGCNSQGATREEALENIRIAIDEYLAAQPEIAARFGTRVTRQEVTV
jgi:predicted RNase H-like HicB family nuclease